MQLQKAWVELELYPLSEQKKKQMNAIQMQQIYAYIPVSLFHQLVAAAS